MQARHPIIYCVSSSILLDKYKNYSVGCHYIFWNSPSYHYLDTCWITWNVWRRKEKSISDFWMFLWKSHHVGRGGFSNNFFHLTGRLGARQVMSKEVLKNTIYFDGVTVTKTVSKNVQAGATGDIAALTWHVKIIEAGLTNWHRILESSTDVLRGVVWKISCEFLKFTPTTRNEF